VAFSDLPDVPIGTLNLNLPLGSNSLLGARKRLCSKPLAMPYTLGAQDGGRISGSVTIHATGCRK
jgi:hypothetical protein